MVDFSVRGSGGGRRRGMSDQTRNDNRQSLRTAVCAYVYTECRPDSIIVCVHVCTSWSVISVVIRFFHVSFLIISNIQAVKFQILGFVYIRCV